MFSATLPPKIRQMAKQILNDPAEVNIAISKPKRGDSNRVLIFVTRAKSWGVVREMFSRPSESKTIIFSSSKLKVKELAHTLKRMKARRGSHAFRLGSGEARAGDARFKIIK